MGIPSRRSTAQKTRPARNGNPIQAQHGSENKASAEWESHPGAARFRKQGQRGMGIPSRRSSVQKTRPARNGNPIQAQLGAEKKASAEWESHPGAARCRKEGQRGMGIPSRRSSMQKRRPARNGNPIQAQLGAEGL